MEVSIRVPCDGVLLLFASQGSRDVVCAVVYRISQAYLGIMEGASADRMGKSQINGFSISRVE